MKNKSILISISILVILLVGFFSLSQKENQNINEQEVEKNDTVDSSLIDTSDWKTCRNEEYGYEFKYPKEWYIYERLVDVGLVGKDTCEKLLKNSIDISPVLSKEPKKFLPFDFSLSFQNQSDFIDTRFFGIQSVYDYYERSRETTPGLPSLKAVTIKETNIDGEVAFWRSDPKSSIFSVGIDFFHNNILFRIRADSLDPKLIDVILSTFKFIN